MSAGSGRPNDAQDIAAEEEMPVDYAVANLNANQIKTWWDGFRSTHTLWIANGPNCTTVVEEALKAGGALNVPSSKEAWYPKMVLRRT